MSKQESFFSNLDTGVGVQPRPRSAPPARVVYDTKIYKFINSKRVISLPIRPDNLDKRNHNKFRNVIKKITIDLEQTNRNTVIAYRRDPSWWSCGGNSLLFYKHFLEQEYHLPIVNTHIDNDYGCRWPHQGSCFMIKNIDNFIAILKEKAHTILILNTPELVILELPLSFDDATIKSFQNIRKNKENYVNTLLVPKVVNPHTRQTIDSLTLIIVNRVTKLTEAQRRIYGYTGADIVDSLSRRFIAMSRGRIPAEKYYSEALTQIDELVEWLTYTKKFNLFNIDELCRITKQVIDAKERITNELTRIRNKLPTGAK